MPYKIHAQIDIDTKNEEQALTLFTMKRLCDRDMDDPRYPKPIKTILLNDKFRLYVLNNGYEVVEI